MNLASQDSATVNSSPISRRAVLRAAAWSLPAIAVVTATPALAASAELPEAVECVVTQGVPWSFDGTLSSNGFLGTSPVKDGNFGTGWLPPIAPTQIAEENFQQTQGAVAPHPASWWDGGGIVESLGFMSLDDRNNTDESNIDPVTVSATFQVEAVANTEYNLQLPVYGGASYLGAQFLRIDVAGVGVTPFTVATGYYGNQSLSPVGAISAELDTYQSLSASQIFAATFTPTADGPVVVTYTFTLVAVTGGQKQNADLVVQAPTILGCFA